MPRAANVLPELRTRIPGPRSIELASRLAKVESRNIISLEPDAPIFWAEAWNANVRDADGNVYIDLTSGFGVAFAGHSNARVASAIAEQSRTLAHGLGDVYPPDIKVLLLEKLAEIAPGDLGVSILGSDGADAVEAALKTAMMRTGRAGVLAFEGAYHGLTYGALGVTWREDFRMPFRDALNPSVSFAPFPAGPPDASPDALATCIAAVHTILDGAESSATPIGAIIVEPILGRGGLIVPPAGFLEELRSLCDGERRVLIFDEVYTGAGRTGRWFACQHSGVVPDIIAAGKALTGSIALSAAIGSPAVMSAWPPSAGEAIHTSTFLGNPVACAAALAQLTEIEEMGYLDRAVELGAKIRARTEAWVTRGLARAVRGAGLLQGVRLNSSTAGPGAMRWALQAGVLVLAEGDGSVLAITPPACITEAQLDHALDVIERAIAE